MKQPQKRQLHLFQYLSNMAYNTRYNLLKYFEQYSKDSFARPKDTIYILGRKFIVTQQNLVKVQQEIYSIFQSTPWLTYRSGYPQLPNSIDKSYVSDTGWGCMVRVGQMLFAQVIKKHKCIQSKIEILKILELFNDCDQSKEFSIQQIVRTARKLCGLKAGEWYNPSQISFILQKLYQKSLAQHYKLNFVVYNSGNLFFDQLITSMLQQQPHCRCTTKTTQLLCSKCHTQKKSVACIVLSRLGLNGPQKKYLKGLQKFMEIEFCQGIIGGKPDKALYFIGKQQEYFIYLDPHYVQKADTDSSKQKKQTYFCQSLRKCKNTSIDSSLGICFYMRNIQELNKFYKEVQELKRENSDNLFIFVADKTPKYMMNDIRKSGKENEENDDGFQIL